MLVYAILKGLENDTCVVDHLKKHTDVSRTNPRRGKRRKMKHSELLRANRHVVEQFNGHAKDNVLKECWIRPRGIVKKAAMVTAGLISIDASAVKAMVKGETILKAVSQYWD